MSTMGDLLPFGIDVTRGALQVQGPIHAQGGMVGFPGIGKVYYADAANGSDNNSGRTPQKAVQTLAQGYSLLTAGQNDVLVLLGGASTFTISDQLEWAKSYTHIVGICAPTPNARARISSSGNSTSTNGLLLVSADGCSFSNFRIYQSSATAACHALEITGDRNYFYNVTIQGQVNTTAAQGASSSLKLNGAEEFRFERCIIGTLTGAARTAGALLYLDGSCGKGDFINCDFQSASETAALELIAYVDANAVDRGIIFRDCLFYNFSVNHAVTIDELVDVPGSAQTHDLIFINPTLVGITEADSAASASSWVSGPAAAAGTAGSGQSGVAVHPT